jgi:hypothetical protein
LRDHRLIENQIDLSANDPISRIRVIDIRTGRTLYTNSFTGSMELQSLTEDGRFCLGFRHGWIDVWDMERHEMTASLSTSREYHGYAGGFSRIASINGRIAISREESMVRLIDPASGRPPRTFPTRQPVRDLLATPDGKGLLTMLHGTVKYWDSRAANVSGVRHSRNGTLGRPAAERAGDGGDARWEASGTAVG